MANPAFASPVGRFVQGDAFEAQTKDQQGAPLTIKTGPNAGQPTKRWFMAVAFPKNDPATLPYLQRVAELARAAWPAYFTAFNPNSPPLFGCSHPRFSIKIMDGDGVDDNGKPNNTKEGFAGHWIVKYSTSIQAPGVWHESNLDEMARVTDPRELPRGFFVRIFGSWDGNQNDQRPGMYSNLSKVAIVRPGEVIQSGPSAADAFGGGGQTQTSAPPTPPAPAAPGGDVLVPTGKDGQTIAGLQAAGWTEQQMIDGGYATKPTPPTPPAAPPVPPAPPAPPKPPAPPHTGFMDVDPNGPPSGFKMLPAAGAATYKSMIDAGWTQELLVQHGMVGPLA